MTRPWIRWTEDDQAAGELKTVYEEITRKTASSRGVPAILKCFSSRPDVLRLVYDISRVLHFSDGHLSRKEKEMIATFVSARNRCEY